MRNSGRVPPVNAHRRAGVLVPARQPNDGALRESVEKLVGGPGRWVDGVWVWDLHERGLA
ncbi:hypothetical protein ACQF36_12090 [Streptomyces sp. Marseille-Q5077]|uniref:hypothetical protein n=1 Tax=Streptomyces sp. Marseille-Q5077 TaxID=3418995 RepID=UPI003D09560A